MKTSTQWFIQKFLIIDLVPDDEMQTGRTIETYIKDSLVDVRERDICLRVKCRSENEFFDAIERQRKETEHENIIPLIHIEGHGCKDSLCFPDGGCTSWLRVFSELRKINILTKNRLFLSSGACESAYAIRNITIREPTPIFGMLAPLEIVETGSVVDGFSSFYEKLIKTNDLNDALESFSRSTQSKDFELIWSNILFEKTAKNLLKKYQGKERKSTLEKAVSIALEKIDMPVGKIR